VVLIVDERGLPGVRIQRDVPCVRIDVLSKCGYIGEKSVEYPKRFFARDYAGNRLEFSL
jgi:hypothetical protein